MNAENLLAEVKETLQKNFNPQLLKVIDESSMHIGHPGAEEGRFHLYVYIRAKKFSDLSRLEIHRVIYEVLADQIKNHIHALRIDAASS